MRFLDSENTSSQYQVENCTIYLAKQQYVFLVSLISLNILISSLFNHFFCLFVFNFYFRAFSLAVPFTQTLFPQIIMSFQFTPSLPSSLPSNVTLSTRPTLFKTVNSSLSFPPVLLSYPQYLSPKSIYNLLCLFAFPSLRLQT